MRVSDKTTGKEIWSYFLKTVESVHGMNHLYFGSRGDYGGMYAYARGYIDNVRLSQPGPALTPEPTFGSQTEETTVPSVTTKKPVVLPTRMPTDMETTPQSPSGALPAVLALSIIGTCCVFRGRKKY
jgi:hypothetical protein